MYNKVMYGVKNESSNIDYNTRKILIVLFTKLDFPFINEKHLYSMKL